MRIHLVSGRFTIEPRLVVRSKYITIFLFRSIAYNVYCKFGFSGVSCSIWSQWRKCNKVLLWLLWKTCIYGYGFHAHYVQHTNLVFLILNQFFGTKWTQISFITNIRSEVRQKSNLIDDSCVEAWMYSTHVLAEDRPHKQHTWMGFHLVISRVLYLLQTFFFPFSLMVFAKET